MIPQLIDCFIKKYNIDKRVTCVDISATCHGNALNLTGIIQNEKLRTLFISYCTKCTGMSITESIAVVSDCSCCSKGIVRVSTADLHKEPSFNSPVVTQAGMGTVVAIVKAERDWFQIQLPDGYLGWVSETVTAMTNDDVKRWECAQLLIVTALYDRVYESSAMQTIISDTSFGNVFIVCDAALDFYRIEYPDGRMGFIKKRSAQLLADWKKKDLPTGESIIAAAKQFIGLPYVWGGISSKGLDCSGFTKIVYYCNGIVLPRDADQQAQCGTEIIFDRTMSSIKPGDLLFFGRRADGSVDKKENDEIPISHVGLSLGGMYYMQASGDIHVSSFNPDDVLFDCRRAESLQMVRRII